MHGRMFVRMYVKNRNICTNSHISFLLSLNLLWNRFDSVLFSEFQAHCTAIIGHAFEFLIEIYVAQTCTANASNYRTHRIQNSAFY